MIPKVKGFSDVYSFNCHTLHPSFCVIIGIVSTSCILSVIVLTSKRKKNVYKITSALKDAICHQLTIQIIYKKALRKTE